MQKTRLAQLFHHHRHAANLVKILGDIGAAGLEVDEIGRVAENLADIIKEEINPGLMGDGRQVQTGIGRATGTGDNTRGILQRFERDHVARANIFLKQVHHRPARGLGILVAALVGGRRAGAVHQGKANRLGDTGHGVGRELAAAGAGTGTGDRLELFKLAGAQVAGLMLADGLEHVLNGDVLAIKATWQDRAAIKKHRRHVETYHRHHHPRQRLVTARQTDKRVIAMAAHRQFDRVGNRLAAGQRGSHALMAHRDAVGDGDGGEFARRAVGLFDAHLGGLCLTVERDVAGRRLVPAGGNTDERLVNFRLAHAHGIVIRPMRGPRGAFCHITAGQFGFVEFGHEGPPGKRWATV